MNIGEKIGVSMRDFLINLQSGDSKLKPYEKLKTYDEISKMDLLGTLEAFVESGFNITETTKILGFARGTIKYRLDRINEISGIDIKIANNALLIYLARKCDEILENPPEKFNQFGVKIATR
jgi:DNA-binding PucR family transcriptional regulator